MEGSLNLDFSNLENLENFKNINPENAAAYGFALGGLGATMIIISLIIALVVYVVMAIALMKIAQKTGLEKKAWWAWIPILNIILMLNIAGFSGWFILIFLLTIIPFIGALAVLGFMVYVWMLISKKCGKPDYLGLIMLIPLGNLVLPLYLAFSN